MKEVAEYGDYAYGRDEKANEQTCPVCPTCSPPVAAGYSGYWIVFAALVGIVIGFLLLKYYRPILRKISWVSTLLGGIFGTIGIYAALYGRQPEVHHV